MKDAVIKEKVTEIHRMLTLADTAVDVYHTKHGSDPLGVQDIVNDGVLKAMPGVLIDGVYVQTNFGQNINVDSAGSGEVAIYMDRNPGLESDAWCRAFNDTYTSLGATIPVVGADAVTGVAVVCMLDEGNVFTLIREWQ